MTKRIVLVLLLATLIGTVSIGCSRLNVKEFPPGEPVVIKEDMSLIFGRIIVILNGEVKEEVKNLAITFHHTESGKWRYWDVEEDGSFYCIVPKGNYFIYVTYRGCIIQPQIKVEVTSERENSIYIGTLKIDIEIKTFPIPHVIWGAKINDIEILDEFNEAKEVIKNRNPHLNLNVEKNLMAIVPDKAPTISSTRRGSSSTFIFPSFSIFK